MAKKDRRIVEAMLEQLALTVKVTLLWYEGEGQADKVLDELRYLRNQIDRIEAEIKRPLG